MKRFVSVSGLLFLIVCSQQANDTSSEKFTSQDSNYGIQLIKIGFLEFADTTKIDSLNSALTTSFDIYDDDINRTTHIDAEELAEFSFDFFLPRLKQILKLRGFDLTVRTSDDYQETYNVFINEEKVKLYTSEDMEHDNFWMVASRAFFKEINRQLKNTKIEESIFLLYEDNDLHAILLTPSQCSLIRDKYRANPKELPYEP